ncbi:MAG: hypothetical protein IIU15_06860 [Treponema sp.]|nr:hypothetical protein [Treponema sp.]
MKVLEINSISKEEGYIYYFNKYRGNAVLDILSQKVTVPVRFSIEVNPLGKRNIEIDSLPQSLNYPVMPVKKSLKDFIDDLYKKGALPQV